MTRKPAWVRLSALELLLAERLRRAETAVGETADEQAQRSTLRASIEARFVVTQSRRHCVRLVDVFAAARARLPMARRAVIMGVVEELGGIVARPRNRRMVNGFRHVEMTDLEGVAYARKLRDNPWLREHPGYQEEWERKRKRRAAWK